MRVTAALIPISRSLLSGWQSDHRMLLHGGKPGDVWIIGYHDGDAGWCDDEGALIPTPAWVCELPPEPR